MSTIPTKEKLISNAIAMGIFAGLFGIFFTAAGIIGKFEGVVITSSYSVSRGEALATHIMLDSFGGICLLFSFFVIYCAVFLKITPIKFMSLLND